MPACAWNGNQTIRKLTAPRRHLIPSFPTPRPVDCWVHWSSWAPVQAVTARAISVILTGKRLGRGWALHTSSLQAPCFAGVMAYFGRQSANGAASLHTARGLGPPFLCRRATVAERPPSTGPADSRSGVLISIRYLTRRLPTEVAHRGMTPRRATPLRRLK